MSAFSRFASLVAVVLLLSVSGLAARWIVHSPLPKKEVHHANAAAEVSKVKEAELGTITLTEEAEHRLGIQSTHVERRNIQRTRVYGGEVMVPVGRTILVSAPMQGTLQAPPNGIPQAGQAIKKGQHIVSLLPLFSPEASTTIATSRADAEGQVNNAQTQLSAMKLALDRAQRLFREAAGSKRSAEEAQAQHDLALKSLEAAESRLLILNKAFGSAATGRAEAIPIESPEGGILRNVSALSGQNVPSGGPLFEVIDLSEAWIRVPVYVGDLPTLAVSEQAAIGNLSMRAGDVTWPAVPVQAPPSANPAAATVDLFYSLPNSELMLTPGQRVGARILLLSNGESLAVPWSSIVQDLHGGTWIYEVVGPRKYKRQYVLVRHVVDGIAAISTGPPAGTEVVSEGAIELFGAETGFSK